MIPMTDHLLGKHDDLEHGYDIACSDCRSELGVAINRLQVSLSEGGSWLSPESATELVRALRDELAKVRAEVRPVTR